MACSAGGDLAMVPEEFLTTSRLRTVSFFQPPRSKHWPEFSLFAFMFSWSDLYVYAAAKVSAVTAMHEGA